MTPRRGRSPCRSGSTTVVVRRTPLRPLAYHPQWTVRCDRHSYELLGTATPRLPRATLFAAVTRAHTGATVEDLTRLLELTTARSLRVVITTTGNADRQT
jgi:hypothetical protein